MNPQIQALLQALMGMSGSTPTQGNDFQQFSMGGGQDNSNSSIMRALGGTSPVNLNPNYGSTVGRFFNQNPLAGAQPFTGTTPLQAGMAGNNAVRGGRGHSSFIPNDFSSSMQQWT